MEYIAFNPRDRKFYLTISRVEAGMAHTRGDIQVASNDGGIILEMNTAKGQKVSDGYIGTEHGALPAFK